MKMLPEQASSFAALADNAFYLTHYICLAAFILLNATLVYFVVKYRKRSDADQTPDIRGNHLVEVIWTVIPSILCLIIFVYGTEAYAVMRTMPADATDLKVTGWQWSWEYEHPGGVKEGPNLHVPLGKSIRLVMESKDVIHSFNIPAFRVKEDVIAGRYTEAWFRATKLGEYDIFCTEYCGRDHSAMIGKVTVLPEDEYQAWLKKEQKKLNNITPVEYGKILFERKCTGCHQAVPGGQNLVGPNLYGLFGKEEALADGSTVKVDENYLIESMKQPGVKIVKGYANLMTSFADLNDKQLNALVEYLKSLKD